MDEVEIQSVSEITQPPVEAQYTNPMDVQAASQYIVEEAAPVGDDLLGELIKSASDLIPGSEVWMSYVKQVIVWGQSIDPQILGHATTILLAFIVALYCIKKHRLSSSIILLLWIGWFVWNWICTGDEIVYEVIRNATHLSLETSAFFWSFCRLFAAWAKFFSPFLSALASVLLNIWQTLDGTQRAYIGLGILVVLAGWYSTVHAKKGAEKLKNKMSFSTASFIPFLKQMLFGAIIVLVWLLRPYAYQFSEYLPLCVWMAFNILPPIKTTYLVRKRKTRASSVANEKLANELAFWACWPYLSFAVQVISAIVSSSSIDLQILLVLLAFWMQFFDGSVLAWRILSQVMAVVQQGINYVTGFFNISMLMKATTLWNSLRISSIIAFVTRAKWILALALVVLAILSFTVWSFISSFLVICIMIGATLDSGRVVVQHLTPLYETKLCAWVSISILNAVVAIPVLGAVVGVFHPILLGVVFLLGGDLLSGIIGLTVNKPSNRQNRH